MAPPLYRVYQRRLRPAADLAQINLEWSSKTKAQKKAWTDAYRRGRDMQTIVRQHLVDNVDPSLTAIDVSRAAVPPNFAGYLADVGHAITQHTVLVDRLRVFMRAWQDLHDIEQAHRIPYAQSLAHSMRKVAQAQNEIVEAEDSLRTLRDNDRNLPPMPANAAGQRKSTCCVGYNRHLI